MGEENPRILVVDDEFGVREGCRKILTTEGYEVLTAEDGQAGFDLFRTRGPFAVALLDLMMPKLAGLELLKRMRAQDPEAVLIIITAHATIDTAVEGTRQGAYNYIPKPFTPDELLLEIKNGLERRALSLEAKRLREERERRMLEVASERSKSNTIISCMTEGVLVINMDKLVVLRNAAAARVLPDCAARPLPFPLEALASEEVKALIAEILDSVTGPQILSREIKLGELTYIVDASPVIEEGRGTSGAVAMLRDITELKKLETAKSMFVSMVAHEVKNPLAAAEGWLSLILSDTVKHEREEEERMIQRSLLRIRTLRSMVSELLNLTAIQTGKFTLRRAPTDLAQLALEATELYREKAEEQGIELDCGGLNPGEGTPALADRDALSIIVTNLIDNAIKYSRPGGRVHVHVDQNGSYARVSVKDEGIGMSAEEQAKVFEEFFRAKNADTTNIPGTGLGLSLVKSLAELHQGSVSLSSKPGKGSSFTVSIPLSP